MKTSYEDIVAIAGKPLWYDGNGVPRYIAFHHYQDAISLEAIALLKIACQECGERFIASKGRVTVTKFSWQKRIERVEFLADVAVENHLALRAIDVLEALRPRPDDFPLLRRPTLYDVGSFSYGDPPTHGCLGDTMGAIPLRVLEYWEQNTVLTDGKIKDRYGNSIGGKIVAGNFNWVRHHEHEVDVRPSWARDVED